MGNCNLVSPLQLVCKNEFTGHVLMLLRTLISVVEAMEKVRGDSIETPHGSGSRECFAADANHEPALMNSQLLSIQAVVATAYGKHGL